LQVAVGALKQHPDVGILVVLTDLGMTKTVLYERLLCLAAGMNYRTLLNPELAAKAGESISVAGQRLQREVLGRLLVVEPGIRAMTEYDLRSYLAGMSDRLRTASQCARLLTIVDYFQAIRIAHGEAEAGQPLDENRARLSALQSYQYASRTVKRPAGDPLLVISQIRKGDGNRNRLTLDDLLGSTELAYAGDSVLLLEEGKSSPSPARTNLTLRVAKARDGGHRGDVALVFDHELTRISEASAPVEPRAVRGGRGTADGRSRLDPLVGAAEE
jgi:replicative DNA helicase